MPPTKTWLDVFARFVFSFSKGCPLSSPGLSVSFIPLLNLSIFDSVAVGRHTDVDARIVYFSTPLSVRHNAHLLPYPATVADKGST